MLLCMATASRPDPFPGNELDDLPPHVRDAFRRWGRAVAALRVYRRRGWNTAPVIHKINRERSNAIRLLGELEHAEQNPELF